MDEDIDEILNYFLDEDRFSQEEIECFVKRLTGGK